jgi:hypothetical protein
LAKESSHRARFRPAELASAAVIDRFRVLTIEYSRVKGTITTTTFVVAPVANRSEGELQDRPILENI